MNSFTMRQLATIRLFSGIDMGDIPHMLTCINATERKFERGAFIFLEGEELQRIGVIIGGSVQMIKEDIWGEKMILETLTVGDIFGESFVCGDSLSATVSFQAVSNCQVLFLPFRRLMTTCGMACQFHQKLIENMAVMLAMKNIRMMRKMEILSKKTMRERILVWLYQQMPPEGEPCVTTDMGRRELAEYLCVDRSALSRELSNMAKDGLLSYERNTFRLNVSLSAAL